MNFAEYVLGTGGRAGIAIVDAGGSHSYAQLRAAVAENATRLTALGLPPRTPVGIAGANSFGWVGAYLAVLASGMVAVPMANGLSPEEIGARLDWIDAGALFVAARSAARLRPHCPQLLQYAENCTDPDATVHFADVADDDDAVYAFTSGTTSRARAVRHTHDNLRANTDSILGYLPLTGNERMLAALPFGYVFGASVLHTHLKVGATLVIQNDVVFPQAVVARMASEGCTGFAGVPSIFHTLLRNSTFSSRPLPDLRVIQQAGGKLAPALISELRQAQPQAEVFVMYGQTEATARLSYLPPADLDRKPGSIGKGIPGVELSVVTGEGRPVASGEVGEIWARGRSISPGYLGDLAASRRKMPDGVLHTGDLAWVDDDGYIYVVDRQEDFIKTWGFRVASQEVEAAAMQLPGLIAAAAVGVPDDAAGERVELVAVRNDQAEVTEKEVLRHCRSQLAKHMVPVAVHFVRALPLNANGKVVKTAVRELCLGLSDDLQGEGHEQ